MRKLTLCFLDGVLMSFLFVGVRVGLWRLMPLSTIFQLYRGGQLLMEETGVPGENHRSFASH